MSVARPGRVLEADESDQLGAHLVRVSGWLKEPGSQERERPKIGEFLDPGSRFGIKNENSEVAGTPA